MKIAILGGTGKEGAGLGYRWATAGRQIIIGSRLAEKAEEAAVRLNAMLPAGAIPLTAADNLTASQQADLIVLSVPYNAQAATLDNVAIALANKLVISVVVPIMPPKVSHVWHPPAGSAAQEAQERLGPTTRVVAAFQNVSAEHLPDLSHEVACDVLICGDNKADKQFVQQLCQEAGLRGIDAGPLQNASVVEGLTAILIGINARYKIKHAGIRITGLPET